MKVKDFSNKNISKFRFWAIDNNDNDRDELFFIPVIEGLPGRIQFYNDKGALNWEIPSFVQTSYPGDTEYENYTQYLQYTMPMIYGIKTIRIQ